MNKIGLLLVLVAGMIFIGSFYTIMHESAHKQIYANYGIESHIDYFSNFPSAVTLSKGCDENPKFEKECRSAHDLNEIVGYPIEILIFSIFFGIFIFILKGKEEKNDIPK